MNVNNKKRFFQNIALDDEGNMIMVVNTKSGVSTKGESQYKVLKKLTVDVDGRLNIFND
tara:strand:+ start:882 stop:1058 length:177 start_codon:yes stop_codon:yes gene_type:complete